ncbi:MULTISPECIES: hypothetical protein [Ureibacillus]|jgi:hypothetical protein|uniref:Uncharacterized protein n=1 Tax=Ureibacillus thermosphaericus TaxID=51173 RepID=A0A840Q0C6_URETH|nr:hypothetical protein [Ureibacillus thermosphaericus]MBB5150322.1 hypothetical protein [Ureibacillus thermosphaericus]NKZ32946.1 hypothetical protein [Ureibacillus thermosphaericus]
MPSETSYSHIIQVINESDVLDKMNDILKETAILESFLEDEHVAFMRAILKRVMLLVHQ